MITQYLQKLLGHHVKFKVCLVFKPLICVVFSSSCKLREKCLVLNLQIGLTCIIKQFCKMSCSTSSNNCLLSVNSFLFQLCYLSRCNQLANLVFYQENTLSYTVFDKFMSSCDFSAWFDIVTKSNMKHSKELNTRMLPLIKKICTV